MDTTTAIIDFLSQPAAYPHHPSEVTIRQTHASVLAIAPPFVYKVKKQVNLGFLDFTTLAARKKNCERERQLNSRLCADLYLNVVPIARHKGQLVFGRKGQVVDYALQMKLLPDGYFLDQLLDANQVTPTTLDGVLTVLQAFYEHHPPQAFVGAYGNLLFIRETVAGTLAGLQQFAGELVDAAAVTAIQRYTRHFLAANRALFARRVQQHKIRDCHGDLHLDHIHIREGKVCIFDCIEFNDRFRYIDVAADIAFLAMDLDYHHRPDLSGYLTARMAVVSKDPELLLLQDYYKCYRACVRALVECLKSRELEVPEAERSQSRQAAKRYVGLALQYALFGAAPMVLLVCGPSGSGKSTVAHRLAELLGWPCISSDVTRKETFGLPLYQRTDLVLQADLYARPVSDGVYQSLLNQTLAQVKKQQPVIVDATFGQPAHRFLFAQALSQLPVPYYFLEVQVPDEIRKQRLAQRDASPRVVSDARLVDYEHLRSLYQLPTEVPPAHYLQVNAVPPVEVVVTQLLQDLGRRDSHRKPVKKAGSNTNKSEMSFLPA